MESIHEFLSMGGYGLYVWSAYGLSFIVLLINVILPLLQEKKLINTLARQVAGKKNRNEQKSP